MGLFSRVKFKTIQGRLFTLLLGPVFLFLLAAGIISFIYTRNIMLNQWNESTVLKLQRAAHYIEMKVSKPAELIDMIYAADFLKTVQRSQNELIKALTSIKGVVRAGSTHQHQDNTNASGMRRSKGSMRQNQMQYRHGRILKVTQPVYDADAGQETVDLVLSVLDNNDHEVRRISITMSFTYLLEDVFDMGLKQAEMVSVVDREGNYIAHTDPAMKNRRYLGEHNEPFEKVLLSKLRKQSYGTITSSGHPPETVAGFYQLDNIPWVIIVFARGDKVLAPIVRYRNTYAAGVLLLVAGVLVMIRNHVCRIVTQIESLSKNARNVAKGDYGDPIGTTRKDEIGQLVKSHNAMVRGLKERDFIRNCFGRYIDPEFARKLLTHPEAGKLGGHRREVAVMMSDLRGFTALSEALSPELIINLLNRYFSHMINIIQRHDGIIVDFFGDAILVFFDPLSDTLENTLHRCISCAYDMQKQMKSFNTKMAEKNLGPLEMGIGINSGPVIMGNIGSETRSKYGIVGSTVNVTNRIQARAKGNEIVISESVYKKQKPDLDILKSFQVQLKGVGSKMTLFVLKN